MPREGVGSYLKIYTIETPTFWVIGTLYCLLLGGLEQDLLSPIKGDIKNVLVDHGGIN